MQTTFFDMIEPGHAPNPVRPDRVPAFAEPLEAFADHAVYARRLREILSEYDNAMVHGQKEAASEAHDRFRALMIEKNGGTNFACCCEDGAWTLADRILRSPDGVEPLWGQPGRWVVHAGGCRHDVTAKQAFDGRFEVRAVDWNLPFVSETGYRSYSVGVQGMPAAGKRSMTEAVAAVIVDDLRREKGGLVAIERYWRGPERRICLSSRPDPEDPAWQRGGYLDRLTDGKWRPAPSGAPAAFAAA